MRMFVAAFVFLAAGSVLDTAKADPYRWCADYGGDRGGKNCYFLTLEQCKWTISGMNTAGCTPNPFYDGRPIEGDRRRTRSR